MKINSFKPGCFGKNVARWHSQQERKALTNPNLIKPQNSKPKIIDLIPHKGDETKFIRGYD